MRRTLAAAFVLTVVLGGTTACGGSDDPDVTVPAETSAVAEETEAAAEETTEAAEEEAEEDTSASTGTRDNPAPAGSTATLGTYEVSLGATTANANEMVATENEFNAPPVDGRQFVLVPVNVKYIGDESGTPWIDLSIQFVGSGGNTYGTGTDDYCGVIPQQLMDLGEMYNGATASGNHCASVPTGEVEGGTWVVEETFSFDGTKVFFALQ